LGFVPLKGEKMKKVTKRSFAAVALIAVFGMSISSAAVADSTTTTTTTIANTSFVTAQQALELQLANRATQLQHLVADVTAATTLPSSSAAILQARLLTEQTSLNALITKVPTDTTRAELNADRQAMIRDNRVYAVMSPQVFELIEASVVATQVATMQGNESTLQSETASIVGLPGYKTALNHYNNFVARLLNWSLRIQNVEEIVLAQTPQGFPGNTKIFVAQNHRILEANLALAYAGYDANVIGLATGGYTGS
jgi:hypothetical protein